MQDEGQDQSQTPTNWQFKPGETITPGVTNPAPVTSSPPTPPQPDAQLTNDSVPADYSVQFESTPDTSAVGWTASEFMTHSKSFGWYLVLGFVVLAAAVIIYFVTNSLISAVTILMAGLLLGAFAFMTRKPRTLHYQIDQTGVHIESKLYQYGELKAFTIQPEGPINAIILIPSKRFMPPITMYYDPKDEDRIASTLSGHLPFDEDHNDPVDNFMRRVRF